MFIRFPVLTTVQHEGAMLRYSMNKLLIMGVYHCHLCLLISSFPKGHLSWDAPNCAPDIRYTTFDPGSLRNSDSQFPSSNHHHGHGDLDLQHINESLNSDELEYQVIWQGRIIPLLLFN